MKQKELYIVRGIPGSGKSTFAKSICKPWQHVETDMFFMKNGEYKFDASKLKVAHQWCKNKVHIMMRPTPWNLLFNRTIVVSNTFTQEWEMKTFLVLARRFRYKVYTVIVENRHGGKNLHGVPEDKLQIMKDRFEVKL
jgi:predicted kinase